MRKRQFDATKYLKLYRDYSALYQYLNGESANENDINAFEMQEKYENKDKIAEMFCKKRRNILIPDIDVKKDKESTSKKSENTDVTRDLLKSKEEDKPPVDFYFKPMGKLPPNYIIYRPKVPFIGREQDFSRIDYMITEEDWNEAFNSSKTITENMRDLVEEMFDKLEKFTAKGEIPDMERCRNFLRDIPLKTQPKFPSDTHFKAMYNAWVHLRKKHGNSLIRIFWKKPDPNDNTPCASFRSRVAEKMQTRRKNKNDKSNYMKLKLLRKEIFAGRQLLGEVMKREKMKCALLDLDFMELRQMLKEKMDPSYQCPEFKSFIQNEEKKVRVEFPQELSEAFRPEDEEEEKENDARALSQYDEESVKSFKDKRQKPRNKESALDQNSNIAPESSLNSELVMPNEPKIEPMGSVRPPVIPPKPLPINEKAVVDPTTVMQIAIMFNKLHYFGMQVDRNRIKISTHKPIKKEEYLNLSQSEIEKEQYYRSGVKPKSEDKQIDEVSTKPKAFGAAADPSGPTKYTIFRARSGRVYILRKARSGKYQVFDKNSHSNLQRIQPEVSSHIKRLKMTENDELEGVRNTFIPVLQHEIVKSFGSLIEPELPDPDEEMNEEDTKDDTDDYTEGFISRYRKRRNKKRGANDLTISFKLQG